MACKWITMTPFIVLSLGDFISENGSYVALHSFTNFYHNTTSKHQKRIELVLIDEHENLKQQLAFCKKLQIEDAVTVLHLGQQERIESMYKNASIFMLPVRRHLNAIVQECLSYGLPLLGYDGFGTEQVIDQTCGMLVQYDTDEESILDFSRMLRMLYFDPEARKILCKGAEARYEKEFTWGQKNHLRVGSR